METDLAVETPSTSEWVRECAAIPVSGELREKEREREIEGEGWSPSRARSTERDSPIYTSILNLLR